MMHRTIHEGPVDCGPKDVGFDPRHIQQLHAVFQTFIDVGKIQCASYLLARSGKIFAHASMGPLSGVAERGDLLPDSLRWLGSMAKIFTATAIGQLLEQGQLYLEQPVAEILPEFATDMHRGITIFHLLTHTSGLVADPDYFQEPYPRALWNELFTTPDWLSVILRGPLLSPPGTQWNYSTAAFSVLGEIIRRVTGLSYIEYVTTSILTPLDMTRTFFRIPPENHPTVCLVTEAEQDHLQVYEDGWVYPAGRVFSTVSDLWKMGQMMMNNGTLNGHRVLGRKTVDAMRRNHLHHVPAFNWGNVSSAKQQGLGWMLETRGIVTPGTFGHEGAGYSVFSIDPEEELIVVFFIPTSHQWVPEAVLTPMSIIWSGLV